MSVEFLLAHAQNVCTCFAWWRAQITQVFFFGGNALPFMVLLNSTRIMDPSHHPGAVKFAILGLFFGGVAVCWARGLLPEGIVPPVCLASAALALTLLALLGKREHIAARQLTEVAGGGCRRAHAHEERAAVISASMLGYVSHARTRNRTRPER